MNKASKRSLHQLTDLDETSLYHGKEVGLSEEEFKKIISYLGRFPNKVELGVFSAMWSEHCSYKSSRRFLKTLPNKGERVLVGPGENAGIIDVGEGLGVAFKVESHNHPSYIEPYQGAATGVGGILRDVFTMGARPFATMNLLRFGDYKHAKTPFLLSGVVDGISHYGNCFGVSNVSSDVAFDGSYNGNILVNAFAIGVVKRNEIFFGKASGKGNLVYYVGAKTGRDGIHGATMASDEFSETKEVQKPTVQVGDPFKEKLLLEACLEVFEKDLVVGIQDMGAAGLTSSSFEMASRAKSGLRLHLDEVPLRESSMTPYEIMLSESQERMLLVVEPEKEEALKIVFSKWDLDASCIGEVTGEENVALLWHGETVTSLPAAWLTDEAPLLERRWTKPVLKKRSNETENLSTYSCSELWSKLMANQNILNHEAVLEQYDRHIGLGTIAYQNQAAASIVLVPNSNKSVSLELSCDSRLCAVDASEGTKRNLAKMVINASLVGAEPVGISDCLNFGSPEDPACMGQLVSAIEGLSEAAQVFGVPIVSGNVSLFNQTDHASIHPTPAIALVGVKDNEENATTISLGKEGDLIVYLGNGAREFTGAEWLVENVQPGYLKQLSLKETNSFAKMLKEMVLESEVQCASSILKGGLLYTIFRMALNSKRGACLEVNHLDSSRIAPFLFSEVDLGVVVCIAKDRLDDLNKRFRNIVDVMTIGHVDSEKFSVVNKGKLVLDSSMTFLKNKFDTGLKEVFSDQR